MTGPPSSALAGGEPVRLWDDDTRLVRQCLRGEESAWSELLSKYKNLIFSIPIKYGFSQEEAADIFQSVCLDLVNGLSKLREPRALAGWLIRVTHNKCFHYLKDKRRYGHDDSNQPEASAPADELPDNKLRELQRQQLLRTALRSINKRCQQLVEMLFFEFPPRPYQEIAKSLTLATGSIGFIRARCLERLRKELEKLDFV
jgi:RNA polymerase sigma factor (sigma-70 family)